jgi:hypothetical protein
MQSAYFQVFQGYLPQVGLDKQHAEFAQILGYTKAHSVVNY